MREYTVREATRILGVSRQTLLKWLDQDRFPNAEKEDPDLKTSSWLIPAADLEKVRREWIAELDDRIRGLQQVKQEVMEGRVELED